MNCIVICGWPELQVKLPSPAHFDRSQVLTKDTQNKLSAVAISGQAAPLPHQEEKAAGEALRTTANLNSK